MVLRNLLKFSVFILLFSVAEWSPAGDVSLAWNHSVSEGVVAYQMYFGSGPRIYQYILTTGHVTEMTVPDLPDGFWYFSVIAINRAGNKSGYSNEVSTVVSGGDPELVNFPAIKQLSGVHFGQISPVSP